MKRTKLLLLIALFLNVSLYADGTEPSGSGTEADPYWIVSLDNLLWISTQYISGPVYFKQIANIDASATQNWNDGKGFIPIGNYDYPFRGIYDGQENTISNLFINRPDESGIGLFGNIDDAVITNVSVVNANILGNYQTGGLVGHGNTSSIINCNCEGAIVSGYQLVGGLVGYNDGSGIEFCYVVGGVEGYSQVGGLVGQSNNGSLVSNCFTIMDSVVSGQETGGLIGNAMGTTINYCSSLADVIGDIDTGGLIGKTQYSTSVNYCQSEGEVIGGQNVGGLIGFSSESYLENCGNIADVGGENVIGGLVGWNYSTINNCYSSGYVFGVGSRGGLIGYTTGGAALSNSFWDMEESDMSWGVNNGNASGVTGKTTEEMKDVATYTNLETEGLDFPWDFVGNPYDDNGSEDIWNIGGSETGGYPYISDSIITNIAEVSRLKEVVLLKNNYPNPFYHNTTISFSVEQESNVVLMIVDFKGQKVKTLANKKYVKGDYFVSWNATDENNNTISPGVYFYHLIVNNESVLMKKCIVLK